MHERIAHVCWNRKHIMPQKYDNTYMRSGQCRNGTTSKLKEKKKRQKYIETVWFRVCAKDFKWGSRWSGYTVCVLAWSQRIVLKIENLLIQWWKWNVTNAQKGKREEKKVHTNSVKQTDEWQIFKCLSPALNSYTYMKMIQDTKQTRNNNIMLVVSLFFWFP